MANSEHVAIVKRGAASIKAWRKNNPNISLDLSGAKFSSLDLDETDLSGADFSEAFLCGTSFTDANVSGALFRKAKIPYCIFVKTNLSNTDFSEAELFETNLTRVNLTQTKFRNSEVVWTTFKRPTLLNTDFTKAELTRSVFVECDFANVTLMQARVSGTSISDSSLFGCKGIETVVHEGPSSVDFITLLRSCARGKGCIPPDLQTFFLGIGLPKQLIDEIPKIITGIQYCSCFVAYGEPDKVFAERLKKDFMAKGISCWVYSLDSTPGVRTWHEISQKRREAEKMIVLCSAKSLIREGVLKEIEEQKDENPDKLVPISLDDTWKDLGFPVKHGANDLKPFLLERNYADFCSPENYEKELGRLLRGLEKNH